MSLGTGDLQVGGGLSTTDTARRYPWQPCEQEPPLHAATTWHRHTDKRSVEKNTYHNPYLPKPQNREGGKAGSKNPQWFAEIETQMIRKDQLKMKRKHATRCAASS